MGAPDVEIYVQARGPEKLRVFALEESWHLSISQHLM